jgi:selenocysteine lyase/cysteine desulfurase
VIGDIRAALAMMVKDALGAEWLAARQDALYQRALDAWSAHPRIEILGHANASQRLPIFSFRIRDTQGNLVHHQLFTRMLSDVHGIQARGGCACAGSYAHRLLGLDEAQSAATFAAINRGAETEKPGWVRLNFSALMTESKVKAILDGVSHLATHAADFARDYKVDPATARFTCKRMRAA